jgi:hypothetical protein
MHRHFLIVVGRWKFENWHLYRYTQHCSAKKPKQIRWMMWDRII